MSGCRGFCGGTTGSTARWPGGWTSMATGARSL
uniref:Uncharacterized protein n=1 Tax=Anguilla anguilla TaxID=7936 RepID=A0A0E9Q5G8_ANGAN